MLMVASGDSAAAFSLLPSADRQQGSVKSSGDAPTSSLEIRHWRCEFVEF